MIRGFHPFGIRRVFCASLGRTPPASPASSNDLFQRIRQLEEKVVEHEDRLDLLSLVGSGLVISTSLLILCKEPKQISIHK